MIGGSVTIVILGVAALAFVLAPLFRPERPSSAAEEEQDRALGGLRELHARHQMLLAALKDLEDDRATDKIGDEDYEQMKQRLSTQAIETMRQLDAAEHEREQASERAREASRPLQYPGTRRSDSTP